MQLSRTAVRTLSQLRMAARLVRPASSAAAVRRPAAGPVLPRVHQALGCAAPVAIPLGFGSLRGSLPTAQRLQYRALSVTAQAEAGEPSQQPTAAAATADEDQHQEQAVEAEELSIVNFYHLVDIKRPHEVINQHRQWLEGKEVRGRIYISEQGINAQYGGVRRDAEGYARWLADTQPLFKGLFYTVWPVEEHMYPKLRLKYRPNLISLAGGMQSLPVTQPEARATPTPPAEWKRMLAEAQTSGRQPLVLDVRNSYEWDAGHFEGAQRPLEDNFHETPTEALPTEVPAYLQSADPDQPVMIYCTGGIRCDVYGTYLRKKGFNNLYTLEGGIQNYMREEGLDHWNGSLFVFDGRMAIRPNKHSEEELEAAAPCQACGATAVLPHMNCANIDCNKLFLACDACKAQYKGCCCVACTDAPRLLRPAKAKGLYGNWSEYIEGSSDEGSARQPVTLGRGEGRVSRRRKRQAAQKDRESAKRSMMAERRQKVKAVMAALGQQQSQEGQQQQQQQQQQGLGLGAAAREQAERLARLDRLRELRQRLAASASQA